MWGLVEQPQGLPRRPRPLGPSVSLWLSQHRASALATGGKGPLFCCGVGRPEATARRERHTAASSSLLGCKQPQVEEALAGGGLSSVDFAAPGTPGGWGRSRRPGPSRAALLRSAGAPPRRLFSGPGLGCPCRRRHPKALSRPPSSPHISVTGTRLVPLLAPMPAMGTGGPWSKPETRLHPGAWAAAEPCAPLPTHRARVPFPESLGSGFKSVATNQLGCLWGGLWEVVRFGH